MGRALLPVIIAGMEAQNGAPTEGDNEQKRSGL